MYPTYDKYREAGFSPKEAAELARQEIIQGRNAAETSALERMCSTDSPEAAAGSGNNAAEPLYEQLMRDRGISSTLTPEEKALNRALDLRMQYEGGTSTIHNDILDSPRTGNALKVDEIKPTYAVDPKTGRRYMVQEFPARAQAHGFNNIVDNYAGYATKSTLKNGTLYQLEGSLNGVPGRFEWIIQGGQVTHRRFIQNGSMNGVPIKP